ncbi:pseudaminic acid synthase [Leptospira interrogans str. 2003000735]|uniref:Pseudaminic acid synthase n=5 Tax=Leptospira interrogans TaxID=173 RepID=A0A829D486_LEPIR|nr:pseudaminic acid synthase [Leptospira interrogans]EMF41050.1 pseudaminic acid synthase [Leptospira interrogans serovar Lora str. TE 1992]EMY07112.1 pseudaminic acid synthase [Leptospira interrogans str. 2002000626]EMY26913.1 pseudaminic acid synthase [Leptospira interrogans serovar Australis str. 200703203]AKH77631.1 N-acetylneuraminate synthase [Leptospira interrogans serovar Bratislava]EKN90353.1 pseudaminic acid synthase [Leptospira interrogans str. 2002000624]
MNKINIGNQKIGNVFKPFIIAEMSGNHNQSLEKALEIVDAAADAGAHAIKLQTYTADTITIDKKEGEFFISDPKSLWKGESLYDLYKKAYTPWEWHESIFKRAKEKGIVCFSSPFDFTAVDFLESLNAPAYKIASFENIDLPLIRKVANTGKPIIISTGMANIQEIAEAVDTVRATGNNQLILLKCTSTYPATPDNTNILTIPHMRELFQCEIGLSDHTLGIGVAVASVALGATVIEKHFTLSRAEGGVDSAFSMEPVEMKSLVTETERAWQSLGKITYGPTEKERASMVFRRSLYVVEDINAGDKITERNVKSIRPGYGLPPKYLDVVVGKRVSHNVFRGTPVNWDLIG